MTRLYIIRHGQTKWNIESRAQGSKNIELTKKGRDQANLLAERMKKYKIDCIYSSDLDRAHETAVMIGKKKNLQVNTINELREMCFGEWEGLTNEKIIEDYKEHYTVWRNKPHEADIPGGEKLLAVQKRGLKAIHEIIKKNKNKNILIVSHGITIKTILLGIMDMDLSNLYKIRQDNTCMNIIEYKDYGPVLVSLNDTAHLENI
ncbi:histidine phosphatase family protein [Marinisporobacter balticus]|uniref:Putative phosphoglycerate mutase n=1 Tax=Marinisporobacter balticus TaxID=2018667 RepID=A0A4V2SCM6_9FIRM|nr:histidine phosphatase family protein [Marinisporobacter balticus]TCO79790.1 putative phosphoglycerate mutase [Marinisporobacter balticus]